MSKDLNQPDAQASVAYLKRVLGIESVLLPDFAPESIVSAAPAETSAPATVTFEGPHDAKLVFIAPSEQLNPEFSTLWTKMVQAMKQVPKTSLLIGLPESETLTWEELARSPRSAVVVLGEIAATRLFGKQDWIAARWLEPQAGLHLIVTHGLDGMLANPDLKRSAWQHLQMVMKRLS